MGLIDLEHLVGRRVAGVRRMLYPDPVDLAIDPTDGDVELVVDDGRVAHFDVHLGETVSLTDEEWVDAFAPPLSPENARYVEKSGKWESFDVSAEARAIGLTDEVVEVIPLPGQWSSPGAVIVATRRAWLHVEVGADCLVVHMAPGPIGAQPLRLVYPDRLESRIRKPAWHEHFTPIVPDDLQRVAKRTRLPGDFERLTPLG